MYLRSYSHSDFEAVYALDVACFEPPFRFSRQLMRTTVSSRDAVVRLACRRGNDDKEEVLGFCAANLQTRESIRFGYVATLDVAAACRGRGIGGTLMNAVEGSIADRDGLWMVLHVSVQNQAAVKLYERLGYDKLGRERGFYGKGLDAWTYRKRLSSGTQGLV